MKYNLLVIALFLTLINCAKLKNKEDVETEHLDLPDDNQFSVNLAMKVTYDEKVVNFNTRLHRDRWSEDSFVAMMKPEILDIPKLVLRKDKKGTMNP